MVDQLDLTPAQLDAMLGDLAARVPLVMPILRRCRSGEIGLVELTYVGARVLRLGPPGKLPVVALIIDPEGRGPGAFRQGFLQHLFTRAGAVVLVEGEQDELPYSVAAEHAAELRRHVVILEVHRSAIEPWAEFSYAAGIEHDQLCVFIAEPSLPDGLIEDLPIEDIPPARPSGPVN